MTTWVEIGEAGIGTNAGAAQVESALVASAGVTPTGSNQVIDLSAATSPRSLVATVTADENVFISIGASPNALTDTSKRAMAAGSTRSFQWPIGSKLGVVTR